MQKLHLHKLFAAVMVAALLMVSFATMVWAMGETAPIQQQLRAREVRGTLTGGQFAQIWLGLQPESAGTQVTVVAEWDRNQPADQGLNFFILDDQGVRRVGDESLSSIALGAGSANFLLNGPANALGASFNANGLNPYTLVVTNDSSQDASFTLRVTNGFITDDSGQVVDPSAPTTAVTTTTTSDTAAAPAATTAVTTTTTTTATTNAPTAAPATTTTTTTTVAATATPAPAAPVVGGIARATSLSGSLPEQNDQHFLGLEPEGRDTQITLRLTIEPQDSSELARRLNFWVLDSAGFNQFIGGTDASDVAIAAGNRVFRGQENERVASFRATGTGNYVVIVYNNAAVPGTYGLSIEGGLLVDDNGQTNESQSAGVSGTGTITGTTATTGTTTTPAVTTTTTTTGTTSTATTATTARTGQPGGTYTVQSGDTLALIARDIYGDLQLYDELCAFNNIADCNVIEVGDAVRLPTTAQISAGATAAPAAAATPRATATPAAAATPAVTTPVTTTGTTTGTTTTAPSTTVQPGAAVTTTGTTTTTGTGTGATTGSTAGGTTILDTLAANGNFNTLVKALEATGLDATLDGTSALTLLAPTDAAFLALRNEFSLTEAELLALPELEAVLRYHVLNGAVTSADISDGLTAPTVEGNTVRFGVNGAATTINGNANVIAADVEAGSGIIHVIDTVIIPPPAE